MPIKILLADKSITIQKVVEMLFSGKEYEVLCVSDGETALSEAQRVIPDVVLVDIDLPRIDAYSFVSALNCVMAQRLVRMICPECKREAAADAELLEFSGLDPEQYGGRAWYEGAGCEHCHGTGYRGRAAVTEFLDLSPNIRQMIIERRPLPELQEAALAEGLVTLRQSALDAVFRGETTLKEINRVTFVD